MLASHKPRQDDSVLVDIVVVVGTSTGVYMNNNIKGLLHVAAPIFVGLQRSCLLSTTILPGRSLCYPSFEPNDMTFRDANLYEAESKMISH